MNYSAFIWLGAVIVFALIEAVTVNLTVIWFAAGSAGALICAAFGAGIAAQAVLFIIISLICLVAVRPLAKKRLKTKKEATNADRIIGMEVRVTEDIDNLSGKGAVSAAGLIWSARSESTQVIPRGSLVRITRIEGVKVFVETV